MKKSFWMLLLFCLPFFSGAQSYEAQQLLLDVQKLSQLKQMLADLKKGYEILYRGYSAIKNISEDNFDLHKTFLDGLLEVSPVVKNYRKVAAIVSVQLKIASEYKSALSTFTRSGELTPEEIQYVQNVSSNLMDQSLKNLETLSLILTSGTLRMNDGERLKQIDNLYDDMLDKLSFLRQFTNGTSILALQRAKERNEIGQMKKIISLTNQ